MGTCFAVQPLAIADVVLIDIAAIAGVAALVAAQRIAGVVDNA